MSKNDPYLKDARSVVEAFEDGIMPMEDALKRVWALMGKAVAAGFSPTAYITLTERCDDMAPADDELDAEVAEAWKS